MADWTWDEAARRYRGADGRFLSPSALVELRDDFIARQRDAAAALAQRVADRDITVQLWELSMRERVRTVWTVEYALGRGGRNAMTAADRATLGEMVRRQYEYLHSFARDLADGKLSQAQVAARAQLYFNAATVAQSHGAQAAHGDLRLPAHPGDGGTPCGANCSCRWSIDETADEWRATWVLGAAEHCTGCLERAGEWAPLVIAKEE